MKKQKQWKNEYDTLQADYEKIYTKKLELEYAYHQLLEQQKQFRSQDEEIRSLYESTRRLKHDMKNHIMVLSSYLAVEDYEGAREYASEILDKLNAINSYVETGNELMNHIINEKLQSAREQGVQIKAEIENLSFGKMKSIDFSALLNNMLDNAVEACQKERKGRRELHLNVFAKRGYEAICVKNRIENSVLQRNPELNSKKNDTASHGIGISRMREITESYQGMFDVYEADEFFCVCAYIPKS